MLDIASNRIKKIENVSHLTELQEFWVSLTPLSRMDGGAWSGGTACSRPRGGLDTGLGCGQSVRRATLRNHTSEPARMRSRQAPPWGEDGSEAVLPKWGFLCMLCQERSMGYRRQDQVGPAGHPTTRDAHGPVTPEGCVSDQRMVSEKGPAFVASGSPIPHGGGTPRSKESDSRGGVQPRGGLSCR